jgi:hypothetical protein
VARRLAITAQRLAGRRRGRRARITRVTRDIGYLQLDPNIVARNPYLVLERVRRLRARLLDHLLEGMRGIRTPSLILPVTIWPFTAPGARAHAIAGRGAAVGMDLWVVGPSRLARRRAAPDSGRLPARPAAAHVRGPRIVSWTSGDLPQRRIAPSLLSMRRGRRRRTA